MTLDEEVKHFLTASSESPHLTVRTAYLTVKLLAELLAVTRDHAERSKAFAEPVVKAAESRELNPGPVTMKRMIEAYLLGSGWTGTRFTPEGSVRWQHAHVGADRTLLEALRAQFERDGIILSARGL